MDYIMHTYSGGGDQVYRFRALAEATKFCAELMPAKPSSVEIGLRFSAEVGSDGGVIQMTLHRDKNPDWWNRYFSNPKNIESIIIQRMDMASEADAESRAEGNRVLDPLQTYTV